MNAMTLFKAFLSKLLLLLYHLSAFLLAPAHWLAGIRFSSCCLIICCISPPWFSLANLHWDVYLRCRCTSNDLSFMQHFVTLFEDGKYRWLVWQTILIYSKSFSQPIPWQFVIKLDTYWHLFVRSTKTMSMKYLLLQ